ncbi:peptide chain release factor 1 [Gehongia tenuis]|uniref:Peptide chain release factor 1 n=1 Tax=Gehongia tenuis TaxID=2763655 RepID=A0A926D5H3_9FIRM|nr:peptide chain release factor 1 [Gehongia tenuis]MBC8531702.1 peptide chain release factor 1 [Gehongia tenuis]
MFLDQLERARSRYEELAILLSQPETVADQNRFTGLAKEHAELSELVEAYNGYRAKARELEELRAMMEDSDPEIRELAEAEEPEVQETLQRMEQDIRILLLPKDPDADRNVIMEIRAGAGGEEAALFGMDLMRMYTRYAERRGWTPEVLSLSETELGGVKEASFMLRGKGAFSRLMYESGVHRVQRVPTTESGGRIHTSTITVAVLPEAEDVEVDINPGDLRIDTYRSSGAGGQHINKTSSAIRITHMPTGIVVQCQNERSQLQNKEMAMRMLRTRLKDQFQSAKDAEYAQNRRSQVGSGDRSERIRTYNFPQGRVTDHRIGLTIYKLDAFLDGDMDEVLDALVLEDQARKLEKAGL